MATPAQWIDGARPRTLPAAVAPVVVGTAAAMAVDSEDLGLALLALIVSVCLQIAVNYANDYSDGVRGTDADRAGPARLVGGGRAKAENVKIVAFGFFGLAALAGLTLVALSGAWVLLILGAAAIVAAWRYTGGDNPYGYRGLGEVYVFVFFGLFATLGTLWTQAGQLTWPGVLGAVGVGAIASAILVANNLRDIPTDTEHGKRTLAVRLGDGRTRNFYLLLVAISVACVVAVAATHPLVLLALLALGLLVRPVQALRSGATGRDLIPLLAATGAYELLYAVLFGVGLVLSVRLIG
ncbi:1,4-dihydroxy-2-naphthoate polyprenyltransferase [Nostocoides sp. F2B08]|uniref:1,4-dihydroxy-2-naphthoate polyprenyltransferase n=1 Tax=Nostocoides sp. F2B08 TaxID=2653936 RepID=UPI001262FC36|nr:1,4-dihydroxy-2-naphthoate polyprenyltransferase [Tetrasphaera sp. F2B08]KAB7746443.1 1,4-dihydroxy-2-naphthoate polyprenyltransferase [Tetrasphaera sp. F2B08]